MAVRLFLGAVALIFSSTILTAQERGEVALAKRVFNRLQPESFQKKRELCGYIGFNSKGELTATEAVRGTLASCDAPLPDDIAVTASYHTHGAFDRGYYNEVPSDIDMESDRRFYMNGYVATPGGRMWFINSQTMVATMVCGVACLPVAPGFYKGTNGEIKNQYTYNELLEKLGE